MADKSERTVVVSKLELIAQLDSARWQLSRECKGLGDDLNRRLSVRGQLRQSIRRQPSAWGIGTLLTGFAVTRLLFRKKVVGNDRNVSYRKRRSSLLTPLLGLAWKAAPLAIEPIIAKFFNEPFSSSRKPNTPHVR